MHMKVGACCKWLDEQGNNIKHMNFKTTTVKFFMQQTEKDRFKIIKALAEHNCMALANLVDELMTKPKAIRMWRIGSEILPLFTYADAKKYYNQDLMDKLAKVFTEIGFQARKAGIRLSFHPSQFVVIGSLHERIRDNSLRELEYHAIVAEMLGYTGWHTDGFAINVHVGGKQADPNIVRKELKRMSTTLRNNLTLENDEFSWHLQPILDEFEEHVPIVLDVHHYWISRGKRLDPHSKTVDRIVASWRGVRPKIHLAITEQALIPEKYWTKPIPLQPLLDLNIPKGKLRIHSVQAWHLPSIVYAGMFDKFDIAWEGKSKNLGQADIVRALNLI